MHSEFEALPYIFPLAYLLGSIPFGLILSKMAGLGDVRQIGSGNIGATNVLRTGNKKIAALTLLLDLGKGYLAVALAQKYTPDFQEYVALLAVVGHIFPIWLRCHGGKGVATTLGIMLALNLFAGFAFIIIWLACFMMYRMSAMAALMASICAPFIIWAYYGVESALPIIIITGLIIVSHRENIRRMIDGEELIINKI